MNYQDNKQKVYGSTNVVINSMGLNARGEIIQIEHSSSIAFSWLDMYCGIDWILKDTTEHVMGIAARIQLTKPNYYGDPHNTFTIRYAAGHKTEYAKRKEAIEKGYFYPYYTLQAYVKEENPREFLSGAIIRTKDLFEFIEINDYLVTEDRYDNAFKVVKWSDIKRLGYNIEIRDNQ